MEALSTDELRLLAAGRLPEVDLEWVTETGSTNRDLAERPPVGDRWLVRVADLQSAGRGRLGRRWDAPPRAGLLSSQRARLALDGDRLSLVSTIAALAVMDAAAGVGSATTGLKWPNDVVVAAEDGPGYRKLSGILAEVVATDDGPEVVIGIGINVALPADFGPPGANPVDLAELCGHTPDRVELLVGLVEATRRWSATAVDSPEQVLAAARSRSWTLGRDVVADTPGGRVEGRAVDLDDAGRLVIRTDRGDEVVGAGDVHH